MAEAAHTARSEPAEAPQIFRSFLHHLCSGGLAPKSV
jgi:hypothetical protein